MLDAIPRAGPMEFQKTRPNTIRPTITKNSEIFTKRVLPPIDDVSKKKRRELVTSWETLGSNEFEARGVGAGSPYACRRDDSAKKGKGQKSRRGRRRSEKAKSKAPWGAPALPDQ